MVDVPCCDDWTAVSQSVCYIPRGHTFQKPGSCGKSARFKPPLEPLQRLYPMVRSSLGAIPGMEGTALGSMIGWGMCSRSTRLRVRLRPFCWMDKWWPGAILASGATATGSGSTSRWCRDGQSAASPAAQSSSSTGSRQWPSWPCPGVLENHGDCESACCILEVKSIYRIWVALPGIWPLLWLEPCFNSQRNLLLESRLA